VRKLGLKSHREWQAYCRSGKKPNDIPNAPWAAYADAGWIGSDDWFGIAGRRVGDWREFEEARAFVRKLKLSSLKEWTAYYSSGKRPNDIPSSPNIIYADKGWAGWGDWLGADLRRRVGNWRAFDEARAFARQLKLNSQKEWVAYCRSGKKPNDIPSAPEKVYVKAGWVGLDDWLDAAWARFMSTGLGGLLEKFQHDQLCR